MEGLPAQRCFRSVLLGTAHDDSHSYFSHRPSSSSTISCRSEQSMRNQDTMTCVLASEMSSMADSPSDPLLPMQILLKWALTIVVGVAPNVCPTSGHQACRLLRYQLTEVLNPSAEGTRAPGWGRRPNSHGHRKDDRGSR